MRLVIIGSGNVAMVLGEKFRSSGHNILQIVGRDISKLSELAASVQADAVTDVNEMSPAADVYLIAVSDDAIVNISKQLPAVTGVVAHTAGSVSKNELQNSSEYGVFYPLQSLKKGVEKGATIPILVDGNGERAIAVLTALAESISELVQVASDEERARLHLAATIVNNFSNHLFALAYDFCRKENLSFELLLPLIKKTVDSLAGNDPSLLQTGPAKRQDFGTMEKHLILLEDYAQLKEIYVMLSESISRS
jgi:predicted short-subunit dehydrogenase-like oxidoreductase (DUF2520 family)